MILKLIKFAFWMSLNDLKFAEYNYQNAYVNIISFKMTAFTNLVNTERVRKIEKYTKIKLIYIYIYINIIFSHLHYLYYFCLYLI